MPKTIRRTVTTALTREVVRLDNQPGALTCWCEQCQRQTQFVEPETAAALTGATRRQVYRVVEAGTVHFVETAGGQSERLWLCAASLDALRPDAAATQG